MVVILSGDVGVYGMVGFVYEVLIEKGWKKEMGVELEVIFGILVINLCVFFFGVFVMYDVCIISLSDYFMLW